VDAGADAVIGHHPHVPQGIEIRDGVPILYSLGNLTPTMGAPFTTLSLVANLTGSALPVSQPVVGSGIYQVESGIPATWWLRVRDTHPTEAFAVLPALLGRQDVEVVLGKGSGIDSVDAWLRRLGMEASPEQIAQLIVLVKEKSMEKKGLLSQEEFREIAGQHLAA
jgi:isopropylmalate/homocitrate/citramalate synthase